jgi:hypothetical protein
VATILEVFGAASGLHINMDKCSITSIFCCDSALEAIESHLPCQVAQFPIRYLDLELSTKASTRAQIRPLIEKVAAKLPMWKGPLMNKAGWLQMVKSVRPPPKETTHSNATLVFYPCGRDRKKNHLLFKR